MLLLFFFWFCGRPKWRIAPKLNEREMSGRESERKTDRRGMKEKGHLLLLLLLVSLGMQPSRRWKKRKTATLNQHER